MEPRAHGLDLDGACRSFCEALAASRMPWVTMAEGLREAVAAHRLSGLGVRAIEAGVAVRSDVADGIREDWNAARRWSGALDLETERIGRAARDPGIRTGRTLSAPILLKGPSVARRYADPTVRTYVDIDLLIPPEEIDGWVDLLAGLGFSAGSRWEQRTAFRYTHHVQVRRPLGDRTLLCELHTCLFMERRARRVDYRALVGRTGPSPFTGILEPDDGAQLVVLALHLAHHPLATRALIWLRDFAELGSQDSVVDARHLAEGLGVGSVLDRALRDSGELVGDLRWSTPSSPEGVGLSRLLERGGSGLAYDLAFARELGAARGMGYLASRLDPRRFARPEGGFGPRELGRWMGRAWRAARDTHWRQR